MATILTLHKDMDYPVTVPREQEDDFIEHNVTATIDAMLRVKNLSLPVTREGTKRSLKRFAEAIRVHEQERLGRHTWDLVRALYTDRAAYQILCWRLFPINELPIEVLERIFMACLSALSAKDVFQFRMKLMSVCSHWFAVVQNTPQIWSTIYIDTHPPFHLARKCIERAKEHQLKLYLDQRDPNWDRDEEKNAFTPQHMDELMALLSPCMYRVRLLVILCDTWAAQLAAMRTLRSMNPPQYLKRLELHRMGNAYITLRAPPGSAEALPTRLFRGLPMPSLHRVALNGVFVDYSTFRNLRVLEMSKMPVEHMPSLEVFAAVLKGSPRLNRLSLNGACAKLEVLCEKGSRYQDWKPIRMAHLQELLIFNLISEYAIFATKIIDAPDVRFLHIAHMADPAEAELFIRHLTGRYPKVSILMVDAVACADKAVYALWLMTMPVTYLMFSRVPEAFVDALLLERSDDEGNVYWSQMRLVCPHLEALQISDWNSVGGANVYRIWKATKAHAMPLKALFVSSKDLETMEENDKYWTRQTGILSEVPAGCRPELNERYGLI